MKLNNELFYFSRTGHNDVFNFSKPNLIDLPLLKRRQQNRKFFVCLFMQGQTIIVVNNLIFR